MIFVYKKNNQKLISWKKYNPMFLMETCVVDSYIPEVAIELDRLIKCVCRAHNKKLASRHYFENKLIKKLEEVQHVIETKEGFNPTFIKEE